MRIAVFGKGGSGKTTTTAMMVRYLADKGKKVLAVDADINVNLGEMIGLKGEPIGERIEEIMAELEPEDKGRNLIGSSLPTSRTRFIRPDFRDEFWSKFAKVRGDLGLVTVGSYESGVIGSDCYHSKLGSVIFMYNRLLDDEDFWVVTDSTAGVDAVGTSMFAVSDVNLVMVEPTKKSVGVFLDFLEMTKGLSVVNLAVMSKIRDEKDREYIRSQIPEEKILGEVGYFEELREFEQGVEEKFGEFIEKNRDFCEKVEGLGMRVKRDWEAYYKRQERIYRNDAREWYSKYYGEDLENYIEEGFDYREQIVKGEGFLGAEELELKAERGENGEI